MKRAKRDTTVFSLSAIDLFASSFGAFILIVMLLFPHYRKQPTEPAPTPPTPVPVVSLDEIARVLSNAMQQQQAMDRERQVLGELQARVQELEQRAALALTPVNQPTPAKVPSRQSHSDGVEFTILGLATDAKRILIVIDMSGSMQAFNDLMIRSVLEILAPLKDRHQFAILGYRDQMGMVTERFPQGSGLAPATSANLSSAISFTRSLGSRFSGATPTHKALLEAIEYNADAIILMSDGDPTDAKPTTIIDDITRLNRTGRRKQIHTVALGDYTKAPALTLFLQQLARRNGGSFVGVSD